MPQSFAQLYTHLIFSTKNRQAVLAPEIREPLQAYFGGVLRKLESPSVEIGVVEDHVHLLYSHSKKIAAIDLVEEVKKATSKWMKTKGTQYKGFYWQRGYGIFSVSASRLPSVRRYIQGQEEHHKKVTFKEEFLRFLEEYGIEYDERYLWD